MDSQSPDSAASSESHTYYTLKPVTKPLPSSTQPKKKYSPTPTRNPSKIKPSVRSINEDDDGYDPYSDYQEPPQFFEENPWR